MICRRAFSLIELIAVVAIIGLLAAGTVWSLASTTEAATMTDFMEQVVQADTIARAHARRSGRIGTLRFDLEHNSIEWLPGGDDEWHALPLPRGPRITQLRSAMIDASDGTAEVTFAGAGETSTYAMEIVRDAEARWLIVTGSTGVTVVGDQHDVDSILQIERPDAD